jgi:hypothetical protein
MTEYTKHRYAPTCQSQAQDQENTHSNHKIISLKYTYNGYLHPKKTTIVPRAKRVHNNTCSVIVIGRRTSNQAFSTKFEHSIRLPLLNLKRGTT